MEADKVNHYFSSEVYEIKSGKYEKGELLDELSVKYKILETENNPNNGMQAMAVAPVDNNGNVDTSKIIIAYAGTGDLNDVRVDRDEVVFGFEHPGSQIATSEKFAKKMRQEYPNSVFNFTGHSLGGYLAVHNAAENKSQATVFNAPDASNTMNKDQIDFVLNNPGLIKNYRHPKDIIGNHGGDKLRIAIYVDSDTNGYGIPLISNAFDIGFKYHAIKSWKNFDKDGNLLDKNGNIVRKIDLKELDIDGDGKIDFRLDRKNLVEEPLFSPIFIENINGAQEIKINYESLKYLSNQLMNAIKDLEIALNMLNSAEVYNNELSNKKENRKETLEQYVINHLEQMNVISMIKKLDKLFNDIDDNKGKYSHVGDYDPTTFSIQFRNTGKTMWVEADDHLFNYSSVEGRLVAVVNSSNEVAKSLRRASLVDIIKSHVNGPMISLNVRSEIARAGEGIINSFKDRIRESFKGENNRSGFDDGIVDALKEVIRVEKQNVQTLINCFQYMNSAVQITAYSFNESDTDLGNKLKENQQVVGNYQVPTVTADYNTFLKQTDVFNDVAVVKAFDKQVDTRTEELSGEMINKLSDYFNSVASRAKDILNNVTENKYYVENAVEKYPIQIYHKTIGSKDKTYYGSVESCISEAASIKEVGEISKEIEEKHSRLLPDIENVLLNLPRLKQSLKGSLEELIYGYDNLSGILKAHNFVSDILNKINKQASNFNSLLKENRGQTINKAEVRLEEIINTTNNVNTMIEDCFGKH
ncbi:hypothetical protein HMPREF0433_00578 [Gemella sanguinis M325]|mgnify:CR=1 FL=1|jgi:hypothetical protein|uniref:DUF2974 domain-containing protein n=1 Tax=Gemella sanguinis TaxID=84135 RepID=A0ABX6FJ46_9BACL|nr:hypothetical protein [Gemella sanguinis]EGF88562.1 hypothetical protein HMPREF0433_00578 [Gemella sanguinis M325]QGS07407.1 hypothetical protein FOC50_03465 [Gemella sanguinis]